MYRLFYNRESVGDVLFVVIDPLSYPDRQVRKDEVVALYKGDKLVGINLFDFGKTAKIKASGMIIDPEDVLIDVINAKLENAGVEKLSYTRDSLYKVAEVVAKEEHPLDERSNILTLSLGQSQLTTVSRYPNIEVGSHIVVAIDGCVKFDGTPFTKKVVKNIPIECEVCCEKDLRIGEEFKAAVLVPELEAGSDFFLR